MPAACWPSCPIPIGCLLGGGGAARPDLLSAVVTVQGRACSAGGVVVIPLGHLGSAVAELRPVLEAHGRQVSLVQLQVEVGGCHAGWRWYAPSPAEPGSGVAGAAGLNAQLRGAAPRAVRSPRSTGPGEWIAAGMDRSRSRGTSRIDPRHLAITGEDARSKGARQFFIQQSSPAAPVQSGTTCRALHQALLILRCVLRYLEADAALGEAPLGGNRQILRRQHGGEATKETTSAH